MNKNNVITKSEKIEKLFNKECVSFKSNSKVNPITSFESIVFI